jgi:hypothetical protein
MYEAMNKSNHPKLSYAFSALMCFGKAGFIL